MVSLRIRFAGVGLLASAVVFGGLAGCDSTPPPPTDASPPIPKDVDVKGSKDVKSIKNRPVPKPDAETKAP